MESSNTSELGFEQSSTDAANTVENVQPESQAARQISSDEKPQQEKAQTLSEKLQGIKEKKGSLGEIDPDKDKAEIAAAHRKEAAEADKPVVAAEEKPAYEPNWKYKAFGKEKELDPFLRSLVTDPESEKKVKEIVTRADAFEEMKSQREQVSAELQRQVQIHSALDKDVRRVTGFLNRGDLPNFLASVGITDQQLLQHLQQRAALEQMSPHQQQQYREAEQFRAQQFEMQERMNQMQASYDQERSQTRAMQLDYSLNSPEVASKAQAWDAKMGPGAFRNLVIETGVNHFRATNQDLSAQEAVNAVLSRYGAFLDQPAPQASVVPAPAQQAQAASPQPVAASAKPVIPAVQGRGSSPIKQAPKSLKDLKKMAIEADRKENP